MISRMRQPLFVKRLSRNRQIEITIHASLFLYLACMLLFLPIPWLLGALLSEGIHELSHYLALRIMGIPVYRLSISAFGIKMKTGSMGNLQEIVASSAGPAAGIALIPLFRSVPEVAICALVHSAFNMLPIYPFDGGRVVNALLSLIFKERCSRIVGKGIELLTYLLLSFCAVLFMRYSIVVSLFSIAIFIRCMFNRLSNKQIDT